MLCFIAFSCNKTVARQQLATQANREPLLLFQKTPCLGICPAYNASLYPDGNVVYVAFQTAQAQDTLQFQLTAPELTELKQLLKSLDYTTLERSYLSGWSDVSSTYITFYEAGKEVKRVKHQEGGPQNLVQFITWLGPLLEEKARVKSLPTY